MINAIHASMPDFAKYNEWFTLNKYSTAVFVPALGFILAKDSGSLLNRACLWSAVGLTAIKATLVLGALIHGKVYERTDAFARLTKERSVWGVLVPPTDPTITDCRSRCFEMQDKFPNSFPDTHFMYQSDSPLPKPQAYTLEQIEAECDQWMKDALAIAKAVREDLKKWSEEDRFQLKGGDLLSVQPGKWLFKPFSCPWLYRGFFELPIAYRSIYNLDDLSTVTENARQKYEEKAKKFIEALREKIKFDLPEWNPDCDYREAIFQKARESSLTDAEIEALRKEVNKLDIDLAQKSYKVAKEFMANYPNSNLEIQKGWKEKFFTPGTKQYAWRKAYNEEIHAILEQVGGADKIPDQRFCNWGKPHNNGEYIFFNRPDTLPT